MVEQVVPQAEAFAIDSKSPLQQTNWPPTPPTSHQYLPSTAPPSHPNQTSTSQPVGRLLPPFNYLPNLPGLESLVLNAINKATQSTGFGFVECWHWRFWGFLSLQWGGFHSMSILMKRTFLVFRDSALSLGLCSLPPVFWGRLEVPQHLPNHFPHQCFEGRISYWSSR